MTFCYTIIHTCWYCSFATTFSEAKAFISKEGKFIPPHCLFVWQLDLFSRYASNFMHLVNEKKK